MTATRAKTTPTVDHPTCPECRAYLFENLLGVTYCVRPNCPRRHQPAGRVPCDTGSLPDEIREGT